MKLIKFDLPINGIKVTTLDELRDNITDELLNLARSGQLERWLKTRQSSELAQAVAVAVATHSDDKQLFLALCAVLDVLVHDDDAAALFEQPPQAGRKADDFRWKRLCAELEYFTNEELDKIIIQINKIISQPEREFFINYAGESSEKVMAWNCSVGDYVEQGKVLIELRNSEVEALVSGRVEWLLSKNRLVHPGERIAIIKRR